ncbi:hypothetical protein [Micromonospora vulcania]|uniref:Uncharacterized protein n=1 Tax=Micromonospora vulcania TaxID=1441873 RepID=A0ABW1H3E5_9ACTN
MQYSVEYVGDHEGAYELVRALRSAGVTVDWTPPDRDRGSVIEELALALIASGAYDVIKTAGGAVVQRLTGRRIRIDPRPDVPRDDGTNDPPGAVSGR